jgi:nicotinic acid phosphoribosyltransferase
VSVPWANKKNVSLFNIFRLHPQNRFIMLIKKIDILNFITDFRKSPNEIKSLSELKAHLKITDEPPLLNMLEEMKQMRTLREVEKNGERAFQVTAK